MLTIFNSLTKTKAPFEPITPGIVKLYVCGITVYDYCHIGHGRSLACFDVVRRYLKNQGYEVKYVVNITDIDDKILARAAESKEDFSHLTARFIEAMHEDFEAIGIEKPDVEPRATAHMPAIIAMIAKLIENKHAYVAENKDVFYDVTTFKNYGQLAHKDLAGQEAGARVDVLDVKRHPLDFVLWKSAKPGEPTWDSPWGPGRPGWHIECSAMSTEILGDHFDIHGGGFDLQFPHHENEIAQSQGATGKPFVNTWMHVGYLQINREKMSKSKGNFFTIREVLKQYSAEVIRYLLVSSHYRSQLNYSKENLDMAKGALGRFYTALRGLPEVTLSQDLLQAPDDFTRGFEAAMNDDFNTPEALAVLFDMTREINRLKEENTKKAENLAARLKYFGEILGILQQDPEQFFKSAITEIDTQQIENLIKAREEARANKAWEKADAARDKLHALGVEVEDKPDGTLWRFKKEN